MTDRITYSPDPAQAGTTVTICYDTAGCTVWPIDLTVHFEPEGSVPYEINMDDLPEGTTVICFSVLIPDGCPGALVTDASEQAADLPITVAA